MITSRGAQVLKATKLLISSPTNFKQAARSSSHGQWYYRSARAPDNKKLLYASQGIMGFAWWWILWHLYTEPGHIVGEFDYPIASKWTDEELGIPSD